MKKTLIAIVACLFAFGGTAVAQKNIKLGHINSNDLMQIMPGRDSAQTVLQAEVQELETTLKSMQAEMEKRYNDYMENQAGWTELIRNTKQREIQDMGARIQEFQENAQKQLQEREQTLLKPIIDRAKKAIEDVAREGGYTYILDAGTAAVLYSQDSDDIMPQVKKKLGLK
jgi:outer membrane protein